MPSHSTLISFLYSSSLTGPEEVMIMPFSMFTPSGLANPVLRTLPNWLPMRNATKEIGRDTSIGSTLPPRASMLRGLKSNQSQERIPTIMEQRPDMLVFLPSYMMAAIMGTNSADIERLVTRIIAS